MRIRTIALLLTLAMSAGVSVAHAQGGGSAGVDILLPPSTGGVVQVGADGGPRIATRGVLEGSDLRELIRSGFAAQLHYRLELWREGGWFDDLERAMDWDVIVGYDPVAQLYRVRRRSGSQVEDLGAYATLASAQAAVERPLRIPLTPSRAGRRYYYNAVLDVEALSVSDLDQLERWLRGELRPAVRGRNNPFGALGSGIRTLVTRVLGGERRHYERRSGRFRAG